MLILRFRLTIRNVNLLKSYILVLKATGFRLTIRNVNSSLDKYKIQKLSVLD